MNQIDNTTVENNFKKLTFNVFIYPCIILAILLGFIVLTNTLTVASYIEIQSHLFYFLNANLSQFPQIIYNLTQFGDALVFLSLLSVFFVRFPKLWGVLLSASIISALLSNLLKPIFAVPRPAAILDNSTFVIIGEALVGTDNSLPSGHSITVFTILSVLMFGFMPKNNNKKVVWCFVLIILGLILAATRVGIGAHFPIDVISGCIVGYFSGLFGIFINQKYNIWQWIELKKYYPVFIILFIICGVILVLKIDKENLFVFYLALNALMYSLFQTIKSYVQK